MKKRKKRTMTLLEIMIVIFIIGIVGSVIGYNMRGSLEQGRAFKTEQAALQLYEILELEIARDPGVISKIEADSTKLEGVLKHNGLVRNPKEVVRDGWKEAFVMVPPEDGRIRFNSKKYDAYCDKKGIDKKYPWDGEED